jgi:hypothetical protein
LTAPRHCGSFSASAKKANTSAIGRLIVMVRSALGIDDPSRGGIERLGSGQRAEADVTRRIAGRDNIRLSHGKSQPSGRRG